jgi:hypothetical protein
VEVKLRRKGEGAGARLVNIGGKTIRGSGFHVVSAWIGEHGLSSGQLKTGEKSNEIKAVPKLLEILDVQGDVVTADAMSCRKEIAQKIREQGAEERGHGRVEWREIRTVTGLEWLEGREAWAGLRTIVQYRTFRRKYRWKRNGSAPNAA